MSVDRPSVARRPDRNGLAFEITNRLHPAGDPIRVAAVWLPKRARVRQAIGRGDGTVLGPGKDIRVFGNDHAGSPADLAAAAIQPQDGPSRWSILFGVPPAASAAGPAAAAMAHTGTRPSPRLRRAPPGTSAAGRTCERGPGGEPVVVHLRAMRGPARWTSSPGPGRTRLRDPDLAALAGPRGPVHLLQPFCRLFCSSNAVR